MSKEFSCLNYCTKWSSEGSNNVNRLHGKTGTNGEACFSSYFSNLKGKNHYTLIIHKGVSFAVKNRKSNACLLPYNVVKNHIRQLKSLFPIKYKVIEVNDGVDDSKSYYEVHLWLDNNSNLVHKYALNWVRYLYEYPYNVILFDAYHLHELPEFRFVSVSNLFQVVSSAYPGSYGTGHALKYRANLANIKEIKKKLANSKITYLNNIYEDAKDCGGLKMIDSRGISDVEFWTDPELFKARSEVYHKNFDALSPDLVMGGNKKIVKVKKESKIKKAKKV